MYSRLDVTMEIVDWLYNMDLIHIDLTQIVVVIIATVVPILVAIMVSAISLVIAIPIVAITERIVNHEKINNRYSGFRSTLRSFARTG